MSCLRPMFALRTKDGGIAIGGKGGDRSRPLLLPCGKCVQCILSRRRDWTVRLVHESQMYERSCLITVTYDDAHLPWADSLCRKDFQDFLKRLRKEVGYVRVFYCGEYGDIGGRPHYHAVLFGYDFDDKVYVATRGEHRVYRSALLQRLWSRGRTEVGTVCASGIAYVAGYVTKKVTGTDAVCDLQDKEFVGMSLKPGIGRAWFERYWREVYPVDRVVVEGRELPPPRAYDKWLRVMRPRLWARVMVARERRAVERARPYAVQGESDEVIIFSGSVWNPEAAPGRVAAIEEVALAKLNLQKRRLS